MYTKFTFIAYFTLITINTIQASACDNLAQAKMLNFVNTKYKDAIEVINDKPGTIVKTFDHHETYLEQQFYVVNVVNTSDKYFIFSAKSYLALDASENIIKLQIPNGSSSQQFTFVAGTNGTCHIYAKSSMGNAVLTDSYGTLDIRIFENLPEQQWLVIQLIGVSPPFYQVCSVAERNIHVNKRFGFASAVYVIGYYKLALNNFIAL